MTDVQQVSDGKVIKFGVGQLNNPTPMIFRYIFRAVLFASGLWALLSGQFTSIDPLIIAGINKWLLVGNGVMNFSIKFFGWDYPTGGN